MAKAQRSETSNSVLIHCPGCGHLHSIDLSRWTWNGDLEKPTFQPSLLVSWDFRTRGKIESYCHSFITDGKIQFLSDSQHSLSGQTVDLPNVEDW